VKMPSAQRVEKEKSNYFKQKKMLGLNITEKRSSSDNGFKLPAVKMIAE